MKDHLYSPHVLFYKAMHCAHSLSGDSSAGSHYRVAAKTAESLTAGLNKPANVHNKPFAHLVFM